MVTHNRIAWIIGLAMILSGGIAHAQDHLPPALVQKGITYFNGGIGKDESTAMKADARNHSLAMEFIERRGSANEYSAGQSVHIENAEGVTVLAIMSEGPFVNVDLPKGQFKITATAYGISQVKNINLESQPSAHLIFIWPAQAIGTN